jgi:Ribosomal protein L7/L12 C-terminal domain
MYCPRCRQPVAAERGGHAVRNTVGAAMTLGLSLKSERWHCPKCGGRVESERFRKFAPPAPPEDRPAGTVTVTLVHPGGRIIPVLKVYRAVTRTGLRAAREALEQVPTEVGHFPPSEAERIRDELAAAGATVELAGPGGAEEPSEGGIAAELSALAQLHDTGSLSAEEFAAAKARILGEAPS